MGQTFLLSLHQFMLIYVNTVPSQIINYNRVLCETHSSNYVSSKSKSVSSKTVFKPVRIVSSNKPVIFSPAYRSLHTINIWTSKTVCCSVAVNLQVPWSVVNLLNLLLRVNLFASVMLVWLKNLALSVTV